MSKRMCQLLAKPLEFLPELKKQRFTAKDAEDFAEDAERD
jgi:hypothetical protein